MDSANVMLQVWCVNPRVFFSDNNAESEQQAINTDFTFELFICAAILLEHRETLLQCSDEVQLIQFTSRLVAGLVFYICFVKSSQRRKPFRCFLKPLVTPLSHQFWPQSSGNAGSEQHAEESRAPVVQLLQALRLGLYKRPLEATQDQRGGLFLSAP